MGRLLELHDLCNVVVTFEVKVFSIGFQKFHRGFGTDLTIGNCRSIKEFRMVLASREVL